MILEQKTWRILSVDDDPEKQDEIKRILSKRMGEHKFEFKMVNSFDEGISLIKESLFDLIFLDVHEASDPDPSENPSAEDQRGEELLEVIKAVRFVPVIFYTGYAGKVSHLENPFVKVVAKGSKHQEIREAVKYILSTGLLELSKHIEEQSRSYMWDSLGKIFSNNKFEVKAKDISLLMARNLSKSLSQEVIKDIISEDKNVINPLEMYQYPPLPNSCNPADILRKNDGTLWMVLTPACDFEQNKAENVLMVKVIPLVEHRIFFQWSEKKERYDKMKPEEQLLKVNKSPLNEAMASVRSLVKGTAGDRFMFLPETFFIQNSIIDFQSTVTHPFDKADEFETLCSMDNPYREEILQMFSKYFGRIGTPDYDKEVLWNEIGEKHELQKV